MTNARVNLAVGEYIDDWQLLKPGDLFEVVGGGPVYTVDGGPLNEEYYGFLFKVTSMKDDGIVAINQNEKYFCFVYMGPTGPSPIDSKIIRNKYELIYKGV